MDSSHAPDQRLAINSHHSAVIKQPLENFERARVVCLFEDRDKYYVVGDVEICITSRQTIELVR